MPDRFLAVVNPSAGSGQAGRRWETIRDRWRDDGLELEERLTTGPGHAEELAEEAASAGWPALVAVGGDGTVHEVANGLLGAARGEATIPMGVIPVGSGNDFVRALDTPPDPMEAARALPGAEPRRVDAGRVNGRFFMNGVGAGFDARVAIRARGIPWLKGTPLYGLALLRELISLHTPEVRVRLDDREVAAGPVTLVTSSNGPSHGGGFLLCPEARVDDGELDLLVVEALPRRQVLGFLTSSLQGGHPGRPGVHLHRGRRVEISSADPLPVHVDGEILDRAATRLEIEILPGRLTVLA